MKKKENMEKLFRMSKEELNKELLSATDEALMIKLNIEARKSDKTSDYKKKRLYIAQINTALRAKV